MTENSLCKVRELQAVFRENKVKIGHIKGPLKIRGVMYVPM